MYLWFCSRVNRRLLQMRHRISFRFANIFATILFWVVLVCYFNSDSNILNIFHTQVISNGMFAIVGGSQWSNTNSRRQSFQVIILNQCQYNIIICKRSLPGDFYSRKCQAVRVISTYWRRREWTRFLLNGKRKQRSPTAAEEVGIQQNSK